jgi:uncharacterized protein YbjT (DUF2867 family)/ligand-binding SRPBCC domain-containing protein
VDGTVLLTGATGYIGGHLLRSLEEGGRLVRCLARRPAEVVATRSTTEVVQGDCLDEASLDPAFTGVHVAYYLVHSMAAGPRYSELDRRAAANFGRAAAMAGVRRIIYLGGLADDIASLSPHLKSRADTGEALRAGGVPVIEFRASVVVGAGSLSFEMIRALVERLPVMVCPRWVDTPTQPIAISDVVSYLAAALDLPDSRGTVFEIGGPDVVSYGDIMRRYARLRGLRRLLLPVPVLTPRLSGLWLALVTPAQAQIGRALVEGLKNATVVRSEAARRTFAIRPMPLLAALEAAVDEPGSHWKIDSRVVDVDVPPAEAFAPVRRIGGAAGWYYGDWLWNMRSLLDRSLGGVGMNRGRRDPEHCVAGDVIDGWRVEVCESDRRLRLAAELRLPGRGWLEFDVAPLGNGQRSRIRQTAIFDPRGVIGRLYWYAVLPFHALLFHGLLLRIAGRAEARVRQERVETFTYRSIVPGNAAEVFRWHEGPDALAALLPSGGLVRIDRRTGGVGDGDIVVLSLGLGPLRMRWHARHFGYVRDREFSDEQVRGPFRSWRHRHRVEPRGAGQCLYEDHIEYAVPGGALLQRLTRPLLRLLLARSFARRHRILQQIFVGAPDSRLRGNRPQPPAAAIDRLVKTAYRP